MLKKIILLLLLVLAAILGAKYTHIDQGHIIILTQQTKVSINLLMGIVIIIIAFILTHYCLKMIQFIRLSPKNWKKYRHEKRQGKHASIIEKALLHQINDQLTQAEYQFKQAYLIDAKNNPLDLLLAINTSLNQGLAPQAQNDLDEILTKDPHLNEAKVYLQAKIYQQKNQPRSAISCIKQYKHHTKRSHMCDLLCTCYADAREYEELLVFIGTRSALTSEEKKSWGIHAHTNIIKSYNAKNQITQAIRYYHQIPSYYNKEALILLQHCFSLILNKNIDTVVKLIIKHLASLSTVKGKDHNLAFIIEQINQKEALHEIEKSLSHFLTKATNNEQILLCRATVYAKKQQYEKTITDYQAIINLNITTEASTHARIMIQQYEQKK